jgi:uroporphyrinogen-III synthase
MASSVDRQIFSIIDLLAQLSAEQLQFEEFIDKLIHLLDQLLETDSVLVYISTDNKQKLQLVGSKLRKQKRTLEDISLKVGEGITGWVAEHKQPVAISSGAYKDERFQAFKQLPEDKYEAFLSVPILINSGLVGVLNLQHKQARTFKADEIEILQAVAKIIATGFAKISSDREVKSLQQRIEDRKQIDKAKGLLMKEKSMSEAKAYDLIRREAMRKRKPMRDIADAVILVFS